MEAGSINHGRILAHVDDAVKHLARLDGLLAEEESAARAAARKSLGRALAAVLQGPEAAETPQLRAILDGLMQLVEVRVDLHRLVSFRDEVRKLHASLARQKPEGDYERVIQVGPPSAQMDFLRRFETSDHTTLTLLGTILAGGAQAAMASAVMAGAMSVAMRGMGEKLGPMRTLVILDRALKEALVEPVPVSMLAWRHDRARRELTVASAGHRPLWRIRGGRFETFRTENADPLGMIEGKVRRLKAGSEPGDVLVGFTAGLLEQDGTDTVGRSLRERDVRLTALSAGCTAKSIAGAIQSHMMRHCDDWQSPATLVVQELL